MSKKVNVVLIGVVIIISLVMSIYIPNINKIENEDILNYSTLKKDGKTGVIDQDGNIVIEPQYEEIIIVNQHKAVFLCKNNNEQKVVNNKNQEIFEMYKNIKPIEISDQTYEKDILIYEDNNKYGLLSITGEKITDAKYEEISNFAHKEGELLIKQEGKYGILYDDGKLKIQNKYSEIKTDEYYTEENGYKTAGYIVRITTEEGYRYGYYDKDGLQVLAENYNEIIRLTEIKSDKIYLIVAKNGQYGVFVNNTQIINTEYQSIDYNSEMQMFIVERTEKYGAMNLNGKKVLDTQYSQLTINGIYMYAVKYEEQKVFDEYGKEINIPFDTVITETSNSKYLIRNDNGTYSVTNSNLEKLTSKVYKFIEYAYDNCFIATNEQDKVGIIDLKENTKIDFCYDLIQIIKGKNIIQAIDFSANKTDIYDKEFDLALEITNANIEIISNGIKVYNEEQELFLDNNGKFITK